MQLPSLPAAVHHPQAHEPFRFLVKLGYAVKGLIYGLLGVLAFRVGVGDRERLPDEKEAMQDVARHSFGDAALFVIGVGLCVYALWRLIEAAFDPYRAGHTLSGVAQRTAACFSGIGNGAAAFTAIQLALGEHDSGRHPRVWAAIALREDWGPGLLAGVGACLAGIGIFYLYEGFTGKFSERLDLTRSSRTFRTYVMASGRAGFLARGALSVLVGVASLRAAQTLDPRKVKGFRETLQSLAAEPFGPALLVAAAFGLLAYALHLVTTAPLRKLSG